MSSNNGHGRPPGDDQTVPWAGHPSSDPPVWNELYQAIGNLPCLLPHPDMQIPASWRYQQHEAAQHPQFAQLGVPEHVPAYLQPDSSQHESPLPHGDVPQEHSSPSDQYDVSKNDSHNAPQDLSPSFQPNASEYAPPAPQAYVSEHELPSTQPGVSGQLSPAAYAMSPWDYPTGSGLPRGVYFGSTPYNYATSSSSPSASEPHNGSPPPEENVAVGTSPAVQEPIPAPSPHQTYGNSGTQQIEQYATIPQRHVGQHKRMRESSSSSSGGNIHPQRKYYHGSEERGQESQRPGVTQGAFQLQQAPMQSITSGMSSLGISAFSHGINVQTQGRGSAYGDPNPYRPAGSVASSTAMVDRGNAGGEVSSDAQEISHAYASQQLPQLRYIPRLGLPQGATSSFASGAGRGYAPQPQGESSAQGAGHLQPNPMFKAPPDISSSRSRYVHPPSLESSAQSPDQFEQQPMQSIDPSALLFNQSRAGAGSTQLQGETSFPGADWRRASVPRAGHAPAKLEGPMAPPLPSTAHKWQLLEEDILEEIISGYVNPEEAAAELERCLQRNASSCLYKWDTMGRRWTKEEDNYLRGLVNTPEDWNVFAMEYNASRVTQRKLPALERRFNLFQRSTAPKNLGI